MVRGRGLLLGLLLVSLALAGCSDDKEGNGEGTTTSTTSSTSRSTSTTTTSGSSTTTSTTSSGSTTTSPANRPPSGSLSVLVNGTTGTFALSGSDADGDPVSWNLAFGDGQQQNGTQLPSNVTHTFAAGNYTARLTLSDGKATAQYNATFAVSSAAGGATTQAITGSYFLDNPACYGGPYDAVPVNEGPGDPTGLGAGGEGLTYISAAVEPGTIGRPFAATFASGAADDHILFVDAAGAVIAEFSTGIVTGDLAWEVADTVPANSATVVFFGCLNLAGEGFEYLAG